MDAEGHGRVNEWLRHVKKKLTEAAYYFFFSLFLKEAMDEGYLEMVVVVGGQSFLDYSPLSLSLSLIALGNHVKTHMVGAYSDNPNNAHQW